MQVRATEDGLEVFYIRFHIAVMAKILPLLIVAALYGFVVYHFSAWQTRRRLSENSTPLQDQALKPVMDKLAHALDVQEIKVYIYEIDPVNGLAAPDGRVFLTRGFYKKYQEGEVSGEELGSVIAHELGHVALGHSRRRMIDFSGQNALRAALIMIFSRFIPGLGYYIANLLTSLVAAKLSRKDEYEADAYATAVLTKAGIGSGPQKTLFKKLTKLTGGVGSSVPAWLMSHPKTEDRIAAIEKLESRWNPTNPT